MTWPWPAPEGDGGARHLVPGLALPSIPLPSSCGQVVDLAQMPASIVVVYPWTGRPGLADPPEWATIPGAHGSTPELEGFRDRHREFSARGTQVFGLSTQGSEYQGELAHRLALPFALLSDAGFALQRAMALPTFTTGGALYLKRLTLAVARGTLIRAFYPVHPPDRHAVEVLAWLVGGDAVYSTSPSTSSTEKPMRSSPSSR